MKIDFKDLVKSGLVKQKEYGDLKITKYARKVFYDNLWSKDARLMDARGIVTDKHDKVIVWPFTKIFNHGENGTTLDQDQMVVWVEKVNGFMGCVTATEKYGVIVSTTGSLDSDYVPLIKKHVDVGIFKNTANTYIFEIVDESDPHIVHHEPGAYLIGARRLGTGSMMDEGMLDHIAAANGWHRPKWGKALFGEVCRMAKTVKHEGFVVRDRVSGDLLLKIKSPHYLTKKFLMRMGENKTRHIWDAPEAYKRNIDEEFYGIVDFLVESFTAESWIGLEEQIRRQIIEAHFAAE